MSFKTDDGGVALSLKDCKLMATTSWDASLSQATGRVVIVTYSLPDLRYIAGILNKRSDVHLVMNSKFKDRAMRLKRRYPELRITMRNDLHAKMVLAEPDMVWLSSANFGRSRWFEHTIGIHDRQAYEFYKGQLEDYLGREV